MAAVYERSADLKDKVEKITLKKIEWKILFSVDGQRDISGIAKRVGKDDAYIGSALQMLASKELIRSSGGAVPEVKPAPKKEVAEPKEKEEISDKTVADFIEPKPEPKVEPKPEPKVEPTPELKIEPTPEPKVEKPKAPVAEKKAGAGGANILVVDDSVVIQKMVEIAFENEQVNLISAMKGEDAITKIGESKPDIILLDIMLPDMSGLEIIKKIKDMSSDHANIPIIILSGRESTQDKDSAISAGANDFLTKPFHDEDLVSKVHEFIG